MQHLKLFEEFTAIGTEGTLDLKAHREKYRNSPLTLDDLEEIRMFIEPKGIQTKASYDPLSKDPENLHAHSSNSNPYVDDLIGKIETAIKSPWKNTLNFINPNKRKGNILGLTAIGILSVPMGKNAREAEAKAGSKFWADKGYQFKVVKSSEGEPGVLIGFDPTSFKTPEGKKKLMDDVLGYLTSK